MSLKRKPSDKQVAKALSITKDALRLRMNAIRNRIEGIKILEKLEELDGIQSLGIPLDIIMKNNERAVGCHSSTKTIREKTWKTSE